MTKPDPSSEATALTRLAGGLLMASGVLIVLLCGGCTVNLLFTPGGVVLLPFALVFAGIPMAAGAWVSCVGYRRIARPSSPASPVGHAGGAKTIVGWGLVAVGIAVTLFAVYELFWDFWVLSDVGAAASAGGVAFTAALAHSLLFAVSAGAVEVGRRILRRPQG